MPDLSTCFLRTYPIDLPAGACFFHCGRRTAIINEYGPEIIQNPPFASEHTSEDWVIVGDVASSRYQLFGVVTTRRSLTNLIVHREHSSVTRVAPEPRRSSTTAKALGSGDRRTWAFADPSPSGYIRWSCPEVCCAWMGVTRPWS